MPFVILPTNSASGGYDITNSLRFNSGSSDNLSRTPASATNRTTWTWSSWVKRSALGSEQNLFSAGLVSPDRRATIYFTSSDQLSLYTNSGDGSPDGDSAKTIITTQVFRDPSAWYHIVCAVDTNQATSSNRLRLYVNGSEVTSFGTATYPTSGHVTAVNGSTIHYFGRFVGTPSYYNGYVAETYLIDGQQLTPSSFGETDFDTGIWKPKAYTGTYGTNGFYLQFKNSASLGTDSSGNGNTFTVNNLTSIDQTTDTPTNNFCTMNPLIPYNTASTNNGSYSEGNNKVAFTNTYGYSFGTLGVSSGKWYWEVKTNITGSGNSTGVGFQDMDNFYNPTQYPQNNIYVYGNTGNTRSPAGVVSYGNSYTTSIIGVALDLNNGKAYFSKDGTFQNSGVPTSGATGTGSAFSFTVNGTYVPYIGDDNADATSVSYETNFGNPPFTISSGNTDGAGFGNFEYAVPSGYYALCTKNLATFG
jgi:hypothetical protein